MCIRDRCIGVKHIIIIADHRIYPFRHIQTHLMGTYLPFSCLFFQNLPVHLIRSCQKLIYCIIYTVIMSSCCLLYTSQKTDMLTSVLARLALTPSLILSITRILQIFQRFWRHRISLLLSKRKSLMLLISMRLKC